MADLSELRKRIDAAVPCADFTGDTDAGYENAANHLAKVLLAVASRAPEAFGRGLDAHREDAFANEIEKLLTPDERAVLFEGRWGVTGFQWGWALNVVASLLEQGAVPNPAIWTVRAAVDAEVDAAVAD